MSESLLHQYGSSTMGMSSVSCHYHIKPRQSSPCSFCFIPNSSKGLKNCIALHTTPNVSPGRTNALATVRQMTSWKSGYAQSDALAMFKKYENDAKNVNIQDARSPDRWMEEFACDIVRNINEAPFLHMLFDSDGNKTTELSQRHRVSPSAEDDLTSADEKWKGMKDCVSKAAPDGMILVHHLDDESILDRGFYLGSSILDKTKVKTNSDDTETKQRYESIGNSSGKTDFWGILVLGKTITRSACYILKTTSVASSFGTITGFCLTKAKCFGPSWHDQMQNSWLLDAEKRQDDR